MLNRVVLIGRLTKDLELRTSVSNNHYVAFTLAVSSYYNSKETTAFVPCFAWNKLAENMAQYVGKGSLVSVEGRINTRTDNTNGQATTIVSVNADNVTFLDKKGQGMSTNNPNVTNYSDQPSLVAANESNNTFANNNNPAQPETSFDGDDAILWD